MSNMTQNQRSQFERIDLRERRTSMNRLSEGGQRLLAVLTVVFIGVLGLLTFAAIQIFDGMHHLIVIGDMVLIFLAIAFWINSIRND